MEGEDDIEKFSAGLTKLARLGDGFSGLAGAMAKGKTHLVSLSKAIQDVEKGLDPLKTLPEILDVETLRTLSTTLQEQVVTLQESVRQWEQGLENLTLLGNQIRARQKSASSALLLVHNELAAGVSFLRSSVEESGSA